MMLHAWHTYNNLNAALSVMLPVVHAASFTCKLTLPPAYALSGQCVCHS